VSPRRPNGVTAIVGGILALAVAALTGYIPINFFIHIQSGFSIGDLPVKALGYLAIFLSAALFLLMGALVTFFRSIVGAILLLIGSLVAVAGILYEPTLTSNSDYGAYLSAVFSLRTFDLTVRAVMIVLTPLVLILAALPPTFEYLRYRPPYEDEMSYRQYPGMGGYPAQNPGYPGGRSAPSGGTAITAGVLAVLGGLWHLAGLIGGVISLSGGHVSAVSVIVGLGVNVVLVGLLLPGGVLLFVKKPAGRWLTIVGSAMAILLYVVSLALAAAGLGGAGAVAVGGGIVVLLFCLPAIATLVLAIVKPTAHWAGKPGPVAPPTGYG
jgi:hypothetical protein